jgi:hypothetical protein
MRKFAFFVLSKKENVIFVFCFWGGGSIEALYRSEVYLVTW